jgi:8-oxo-dGTP pyrophosphatase MutT (NUDIX family)
MKTVNRRIVTGYVVSNDGKLLLGRKAPGSGAVYADCWHNPGGGVDQGETDEQALRRELLEETGIDTSRAKVTLVDNQGTGESTKVISGEQILVKMQFNVYKIALDKPADQIQAIESDDLTDFQWFPIDKLEHIDLTPPAKELLKRIGSKWLEGK